MCNTVKEIWKTLLITHQGNNQVKDNKIDLLVQQYEQFVISEDESINSDFARFNTIITSLKALDEGYSSKNYVRKFLRALHPKWRAKVTAIEESKDLCEPQGSLIPVTGGNTIYTDHIDLRLGGNIEDESGNEDGSKDVIGIVIGIGDVVQVNSNLFKSFKEQLSLKMLTWQRCGMNKQAKVNPLSYIEFKLLGKVKYWNKYEGREDYDASEFKIEMLTPEVRVVSPYVFMQGAGKKMVGTIHEVELVNNLFSILFSFKCFEIE
ncbi:hypothetical protein Tco_0132262 [Tanacetum coccineum]